MTDRIGHRIRHRNGYANASSGQIMVVFSLTLVVFIGALALGVGLSHLRAEAENAQRAANAAALAGAVFMPDYPSQAFYRAGDESTKNGFTNGVNSVSVVPAAVPGHSYRLQVTVSESVPLFFGSVFGIGVQRVTRTATAEYLPPLEMGSPDYVLGYAPFPTTIVTGTVPQNFYLNSSGLFDIKENGEPYSPYFESYSNASYTNSFGDSGTHNGPCTGDPTCGSTSDGSPAPHTLTTNARHTTFAGYTYVIDDPMTNTLLIKLFDPYNESVYDNNAKTYATSNAPENQRPQSGSVCILGKDATGACRSKMIDGTGATVSQFGQHGTSLLFSLAGPFQTAYDPRSLPITTTASAANPQCTGQTINCVLMSNSSGFLAGDDPTVCTTGSCPASPYAYRFVNYAVIHGPGIYRVNVNAAPNADGTYGTIHNTHGLAVCGASPNDPTWTGGQPLTTTIPGGAPAASTTSDPMATTSGTTSWGETITPGWNPASCVSPNFGVAGCDTPRFAPAHTCVHLYADGKMPIYNLLGAGKSLIPLGYIPPDYAGKTLNVDLFDPGDITNLGGSAGCPSGQTNCLQVLTPAGDATYNDNTSPANDPVAGPTFGTPFLPNLPYSWYAAPDLAATTYGISGTIGAPNPVMDGKAFDVGTSSPWNGSWVHMKMNIPANYTDMVTQYGGYWKMLYRIGGDGHDATTWQISVDGSAVHLITPPA